MKIIYTKHAKDKFLDEKFVPQLKIAKSLIKKCLNNPDFLGKQNGKLIAIGAIDSEHSLVVIYKKIKGLIRVITFWPAKKGRYEAKILQRR